jgi:hypothetical protein
MIKGLTDKAVEGFPRIGRLSKGDHGPDGMMRDLDYFTASFDDEAATQAFARAYGPKPREVHFYLPANRLAECWKTQYEGYITGRMVAASDGEFFSYLVDLNTYQVVVSGKNRNAAGQPVNVNTGLPEPHRAVVGKTRRGDDVTMKATGRLSMVLPRVGRFATVELRTSSYLDVVELDKNLKVVETMAQMNGLSLMEIPMIVRRKAQMINFPNRNGGTNKRESWLLHVEVDARFAAVKLIEYESRLELPAPAPEVVQGEFRGEPVWLPAGEMNMSRPLPRGQSYHEMDEAGRRVY